jgi:hypothetical protein
MIDWGLATRRQTIGGGARRRRGRQSEKSLLLLPLVETRAVAAAVCMKSPCFCGPWWRRAPSPRPSQRKFLVFVAPGGGAATAILAVSCPHVDARAHIMGIHLRRFAAGATSYANVRASFSPMFARHSRH